MSRVNGKRRVKGSMGTIVYVPCEVEPGMFRGEYLVSLTAYDPREPGKQVPVKLFADERDIKSIQGSPERRKPVKALLRVAVANKGKGFAEVVFPQPAQPVGNSALFEENLLEAV
jgi:hypothetical protein